MDTNLDSTTPIRRSGNNSAEHCVGVENFNCSSSQTDSSPVWSKICQIRDRSGPFLVFNVDSMPHLQKYEIAWNDLCMKIYISVDICPDSLVQGTDPTDEAIGFARAHAEKGDEPTQFIPKRLGGHGDARNVFSINPAMDRTEWKLAEDKVHEHLKKGGTRMARLVYGIEYNCFRWDKISRPFNIHYHFRLYENGQLLPEIIEGTFQNMNPIFSKETFRGEEFKFVPYIKNAELKYEPQEDEQED